MSPLLRVCPSGTMRPASRSHQGRPRFSDHFIRKIRTTKHSGKFPSFCLDQNKRGTKCYLHVPSAYQHPSSQDWCNFLLASQIAETTCTTSINTSKDNPGESYLTTLPHHPLVKIPTLKHPLGDLDEARKWDSLRRVMRLLFSTNMHLPGPPPTHASMTDSI